MSQTRVNKLHDVRAQIDDIDRRLFDLLIERSACVEQVAHLKQDNDTAMPLRPAREAQQLIQLADWVQGSTMPLAAIMRIWREIISAAIAQQGGVSVFMVADNQPLAQDYFGATGHYETVADCDTAMDKAERHAGIAVVSLSDILARDPLRHQEGCFFARLSWVGHDHLFAYAPVAIDDMADDAGICRLAWVAKAAVTADMTVLGAASGNRSDNGSGDEADTFFLVEMPSASAEQSQSSNIASDANVSDCANLKVTIIGSYANFKLRDRQSS